MRQERMAGRPRRRLLGSVPKERQGLCHQPQAAAAVRLCTVHRWDLPSNRTCGTPFATRPRLQLSQALVSPFLQHLIPVWIPDAESVAPAAP